MLGRTPKSFIRKQKAAIEIITYGVEFYAIRDAVEQVQSVIYMLPCLGVKVKYATLLCGDNRGVIQNSTILDSILKKKHVDISYHRKNSQPQRVLFVQSRYQEKTTHTIF